MDGEEQPFGHTHRRQKRSHAQMEDEGSASPSWRAEPFTNPEDVPSRQTNTARHTNYISARPDPGQGASRSPFPQFYPRFNPNLPQPPTRPSAFESALRAARPPMRIAPAMQRETHGLPASSSTRYVGDGLDFRWPAGSSREQNIGPVDLTGDEDDDRMPVIGQDTERFDDDVVTRQNTQGFNDDNVIDLTADDPEYRHPYRIDNVNFSGLPRSNESRYPYDDIVAERNRIHTQAHANNVMTRLPRGMDIIIDLDNGQEEWRMATPAPEPTVPEPTAQEPAVPEPSSPDIEFISSRTIDPRRLPRPASGGNNSDGDEVEFLRENALPEAEIRRRRNRELDNVLNLFGTLNGRFTHLRAQVDRFNAQINRTAGRFHEPTPPARNTTRGHAHIRLGTFVAPVMDFDTIGFELGPRPREQPVPPPTYNAPPEAPEGFTRSPDDEGELVCPNCDEELCVGSDEIKRQVWIVKACGHVYCGECTANRAAKRTVKGKEKPTNTNPFKTCVVDGCDKNVSHKKSMIQVFL